MNAVMPLAPTAVVTTAVVIRRSVSFSDGVGNGTLTKIAMTLSRPFQKTVQQGADTGVWLATSDEVSGVTGGYWYQRRRKKGTRNARDEDAPGRLWAETERIVAREGVPLNVPDVTQDPRYVMVKEHIRSELAVPMILDQKVMGVISVDSTRRGNFKEDDVQLLSIVGTQATPLSESSER